MKISSTNAYPGVRLYRPLEDRPNSLADDPLPLHTITTANAPKGPESITNNTCTPFIPVMKPARSGRRHDTEQM